LARDWHRRIYKGVQLPAPYFAGGLRGSDRRYPELIDYEVMVGGKRGVPARKVRAELARFEDSIQEAVNRLDPVIPVGAKPEDATQLYSVLTLCANAHGEWVRIHPFANGNGRTARLWANWCAVRYGLPAFVRLKPRPDGLGYAIAAARSMDHDYVPMISELAAMLEERLRQPEE
jgi:fido (protein-threonine AMPylation protein)